MTPLEKIIKSKEVDSLKFKPERDFYQKVNIRQRRFWQLVRGDKPATITELKAIAAYFNVHFLDLILEKDEQLNTQPQ